MALMRLWIVLLVGLPLLVPGSVQRGKEGSPCIVPPSHPGTCVRLLQCPAELRRMLAGLEPRVCRQGAQTVVCCQLPKSRVSRSLDEATQEQAPGDYEPLPLTLRPGSGSDWPDDYEEGLGGVDKPSMSQDPRGPSDGAEDDDVTFSQRIVDDYQQGGVPGAGTTKGLESDVLFPGPVSFRPTTASRQPHASNGRQAHHGNNVQHTSKRPGNYYDLTTKRPTDYYTSRPLDASSHTNDFTHRPQDYYNDGRGGVSSSPQDINNRPSDFNNRPSDFNNRPSDLNNRPSDLNNRPSDLNNRPSDFNNRPFDSTYRPSDFNNHPSDFNNRPSDFNNRPSDFNNRPSDFANRPLDFNSRPPGFTRHPPNPMNRPSASDSNSRPRPSVWGPPTIEPAQQERTTQRARRRQRISERKCAEYARLQTESVAALPLETDPQPAVIQVQKCEQSSVPLIVGGVDAKLHEFPHMVAVGYLDRGRIAWNCGGSLISETWVLAAAHCASTHLGRPVRVRLGEHNLVSSSDGAHPLDVDVRSVVPHPEYQPPARYHDIALLRLAKKVTFGRSIRPACLYSEDGIHPNESLIATGWGHTENAGEKSHVLQKVVLNPVEHHVCGNLYAADTSTSYLARGIMSDSQLCAGVLSGGKDTCQGDSGGPLQVTSRNNRCVYHVVGVTSFGKVCGARNSAGVYTRVSKYLSWIESYVWPLERKVEV